MNFHGTHSIVEGKKLSKYIRTPLSTMATAMLLWDHMTSWRESHMIPEFPGKLAGDCGGPCLCSSWGSVVEYQYDKGYYFNCRSVLSITWLLDTIILLISTSWCITNGTEAGDPKAIKFVWKCFINAEFYSLEPENKFQTNICTKDTTGMLIGRGALTRVTTVC